MRETGQLVDWNDDRGFGFIRGAGGERYFVHIKSIERIATRPFAGDRVDFEKGVDQQGRPRAIKVRILGANSAPSRQVRLRGEPAANQRPFDMRLWLALALIALLGYDLVMAAAPVWLGLAYLVMGALSFGLYAADKRYAQAGQWRIAEVTLHGVDLAFGIVGGLLGQSRLRHKTAKPGFALLTWCLVGVHLLWLAGIAAGRITPSDLAVVANLFN